MGLADFLQLASEREGVPDDDARLDFADGGIGKYATGMPVYNPTIDRLQEAAKNELIAAISPSTYVYGGGASQMTPMASDGLVDGTLEKAAAIKTVRPDRHAAVAEVAGQRIRRTIAMELADEQYKMTTARLYKAVQRLDGATHMGQLASE